MASGSLWISLFCVLGASVRAAPHPAISPQHTAWQQLLAEYTRTATGSGASPYTSGGRPVLLLPVPIPVSAPGDNNSGCADQSGQSSGGPTSSELNEQLAQEYPAPKSPQPAPLRPASHSLQSVAPPSAPAYAFHRDLNEYDFPQIPSISSNTLIELYRAQNSRTPELPPVLLQDYQATLDTPVDARDLPAGYQYEAPAGIHYPEPTRGRYVRQAPTPPPYPESLMLKAELTAHKADYTEPYTAWYDGRSGSSRVDFHDGAASSYRVVTPTGDVQHVLKRVERSDGDGSAKRRCLVAAPQPAARPAAPSLSSLPHPALPDLSDFSFGGFTRGARGAPAEVWRRVRREVVGEEELTHRHEMTLERAPDGTAMPIRYSVSTDSSVLGPASDSYEHRYREVRAAPVPEDKLSIDIDSECQEVQSANASQPTTRSLLDPLSGFVQPLRDTLFSDFFNKFTQDFGRKYVDKAERVLRMNVLGQTWRWLQAFNRQGATFEVGVNFLADRLDAELAALRGVAAPGERLPAERFPHADKETEALAAQLPDAFDWRDKGAVTPPRYQGTCASCWAFAVTAAVETALWAASGKLVPLAEQALVDCGNKTGTHGCGGTWPSFAYDYVQEQGLPAADKYTPYAEKVLQCRDHEVPAVTRISAHVNVTSNSVSALKVAISKHAPAVVIIDATTKSFIFYKKGVLYDDQCGKKRGELNHAVTAVGWGTENGEPHFIVKNSWSNKWGEDGYIRLQARANTCGVLTLPSFPRLEKTDALNEKISKWNTWEPTDVVLLTIGQTRSEAVEIRSPYSHLLISSGKKRGELNHAVTAVGWGTENGEPHFIVKNSWSNKWGEDGYIRLQARANTCGVLTLPSFPRLEKTDALNEKSN